MALAHGYMKIQDALDKIHNNEEEKDLVHNEAKGLLQKMTSLEIDIYTKF